MIIIPARLKSTRFEEKILCDIKGVPMFIATAKKATLVDEVCIAVDDEKVLEIAKNQGFKAVLTSKTHESGTDRINETCQILKLKDEEIIINVQADEPFIEVENLFRFKKFSEKCLDKEAFMASCFKKINPEQAKDANLVKVLCDKFGFALYFSRAKIPFERETYKEEFKGHLGIYAYSVRALREFCAFESSSLEKAEKLEQLRALENGKKIKMLEISTQSMGIDTKEDYEKALKLYVGE
ncbi:3-deoxy-manno-octulosonate cytidylyltransferase [Campylobacter helveticus]|uniref:3-deoxy-manno-octulosonate cytidylyltransferase n=1 Tax=Campylobacter helveticus TaxID=28898 RepID=A0AAX2UKU8_9BACT|nr:3-deoxy-manno-octulosonate cytidylyltransferase [Campylobacter helveticus]ARE81003.1 3-deoxy-D-manno-octulosonate cytidylyltransferase [Campylobacter helveticus]MCR2039185.1 3-deoxy-manno-octulosonate cytidylyltransferase [Campylobacter helveticus]MCR2054023.1 3-deoxy-manno-octulosonate cytidylyltransferase [Campylobacter helveticus]MCR2056076.1 3-deoxy-manno-octulosonate cytidylyltransferase [Campylobacter helveticus]MCR2059303.1 3-deoxy-manno-octulosonate cytidylyltransferase [Campylobact